MAAVRLLAAIPTVLIAALLAQSSRTPSRPARGRADAGDRPILLGTDPPGRLRPDSAADGGIAATQRDGGSDLALQREIQQLRARVDSLEQERAQTQHNARQLEQVVQELQQLRQQVADAEAQRQAAEEQQRAQRASTQAAVDSLYSAQQRLAGGDSAIEAQLDQAQSTFSGQAQRDIQAARNALRNRDLATARALLNAAISDAQSGR
jgi:predicted component of type VI protein secretion system